MYKLSSFSSVALTSSAHIVRMLFGLFLIKLISLYLGPEGLGRLGQFLSFATILSLLAGGGIVNGVIKFVAEYKSDSERLKNFMDEAVSYTVFCSCVVLILCVVFSHAVSSFLFQDPALYWVFILMGVAQCGYATTNLVSGVVNGLKQTSKYAFIQITGSLLAVPVVYFLIRFGGLPGAALAIVSATFITVLPALYVGRNIGVRFSFLLKKVRFLRFGKLPHYSVMLISSAIAFPVVEIIIRQWLIQNSGYSDAGLWQGATRLSSAYLGFFSVFLAYVFLPLISEQSAKEVIFKIVVKYMVMIAGLFLVGAVILYAWRYFFIGLLFSESFSALGDVLIYQLIGDFFKICAYVIGFVGVAKGATSLYIAAECFQSVVFIACVYGFGSTHEGLKSVMASYALTYAFYFVACCVALFIYMNKRSGAKVEVIS